MALAASMLLGILVANSFKVTVALVAAVALIAAAMLGSAIPFWLVMIGIVWQAPIGNGPHLVSMQLVEAVVPLTALGLRVHRKLVRA